MLSHSFSFTLSLLRIYPPESQLSHVRIANCACGNVPINRMFIGRTASTITFQSDRSCVGLLLRSNRGCSLSSKHLTIESWIFHETLIEVILMASSYRMDIPCPNLSFRSWNIVAVSSSGQENTAPLKGEQKFVDLCVAAV